MQRCERSVVNIPGPSNGRLEYSDYQCRPFPLKVQDGCEDENHLACAEWVSAQYFTELGIGFSAMALVALLIGVSTHSRRRRVWRAVAGLVLLHGTQLVIFSWAETNPSQPSSSLSPLCSSQRSTAKTLLMPLNMLNPVGVFVSEIGLVPIARRSGLRVQCGLLGCWSPRWLCCHCDRRCCRPWLQMGGRKQSLSPHSGLNVVCR